MGFQRSPRHVQRLELSGSDDAGRELLPKNIDLQANVIWNAFQRMAAWAVAGSFHDALTSVSWAAKPTECAEVL